MLIKKISDIYSIYRKLFGDTPPNKERLKFASIMTDLLKTVYTVGKQDAIFNNYRLAEIKKAAKEQYNDNVQIGAWLLESIETVYNMAYKGEA